MVKKKYNKKQRSKIDPFWFSDFFSRFELVFVLSILIVAPFVLFWQATGFELVWDDIFVHLTENPYLNPPSYNNLLHFWVATYKKLYIPVSYDLWGVIKIIGSGHSFSYHFVNIFVHALNGILVFTLLKQFVKKNWAAMAGTMLFIVHPLQVEAVVWVSEFRGLVAGFFCFLSLYFYIRACHAKYDTLNNRLWHRYWAISWILFSCSVLSKPSTVVMPLFAILFENYLYRPPIKQIVINIWIFFVPVVVITLITSLVQPGSQVYPFWAKPLIWMDAISFYLYKLFVPFSLAASYARTPSYIMGQWWFYLVWIVPVCFGVCFWRIRKKEPLLVLAALLFIIGFLPVSGLIEFSFQKWSTVADRYLYLSMLGIALCLGTIATYINKKWQWSVVFLIIISFAGWSGFVQIKTWKNSFSLWNHCIAITPMEYRSFTNRGMALSKTQDYDKAIFDYNRAISIYPNDAIPYHNRGMIYAIKKEFDRALLDFNKAISLDPIYANAYYHRGLLSSERNEFDKAILDYNKAISINSKKADYYSSRGVVYGLRKEYDKAILEYNKAILINSKYVEAYYNKAVTLFYLKDYKKALINIQKSQSLGKKINSIFLKELKMKVDFG